MLTMAPSSGPSEMPAVRARVGGIRRGQRLLAIDGEAGARAFALRIGDARQRGSRRSRAERASWNNSSRHAF